MTEKRFKEQNLENHLNRIYDTTKGEVVFDEDIVDLLNALHDENEKLHHAIVETEKMVQSTYDELTKLRCIKKNLGRIKAQWDWIMEAIQYD